MFMGIEQNQPEATEILPQAPSCVFICNTVTDVGFAKTLSRCNWKGRSCRCLVLAAWTLEVVETPEPEKENRSSCWERRAGNRTAKENIAPCKKEETSRDLLLLQLISLLSTWRLVLQNKSSHLLWGFFPLLFKRLDFFLKPNEIISCPE